MSRDRPSCAASPSPPDLTLFPEDELVSLDELQEKVAEFEDYVQSTDVAAMQSKRLALRVHGRSLIRFASRRAVRSVYYVRRRVVCIRIGVSSSQNLHCCTIGSISMSERVCAPRISMLA